MYHGFVTVFFEVYEVSSSSLTKMNVWISLFWMYVLIVERPTSHLDIWRSLPATGLSTDGMTRFSTEALDSGEALIAKGDEEKKSETDHLE